MNPVTGITELIRLLQTSDRYKTKTGDKTSNAAKKDEFENVSYRSSQEVVNKILKEVEELKRDKNDSRDIVDIFVHAIISWKFQDYDENLDLNTLAKQVKEAIFLDPAIKSQLEKIFD